MANVARPLDLRRVVEPAIAAGLTLLAVLVASRLTSAGHATSQSTMFLGLLHGLIDALAAAAIVLVYQTVRIFNFAQLSLGLFGAAAPFTSISLLSLPS